MTHANLKSGKFIVLLVISYFILVSHGLQMTEMLWYYLHPFCSWHIRAVLGNRFAGIQNNLHKMNKLHVICDFIPLLSTVFTSFIIRRLSLGAVQMSQNIQGRVRHFIAELPWQKQKNHEVGSFYLVMFNNVIYGI